MTTTADLAPDQQIARLLPPGFSEYRSVIAFNRDGHLTAAEIRCYLQELVGLLGMTLAASPGIVTGWCEHGLAGWAHITTSGIELMGYPQPDGTETVTVGINSCRDYDLDAAAALTAAAFGVADGHITAVRVLTLLGRPRPGVRLPAMARDPGEIVRAGYDRATARYRALEHDSAPWPRAEWIAELTKTLRPGAAILDLGCAAGVPVAAELASRYRVTGLDISPEHIQQAARNVPDAEFVCADARTVTFPAGHFDAIISLYMFDHIPRDGYGALLGRLCRWLRPDGLLLLCTEDRDEPGIVEEWLGVDMYFSMVSADVTSKLVREAGFDIEKTALRTQTEGQTDLSYIWILARKASLPA